MTGSFSKRAMQVVIPVAFLFSAAAFKGGPSCNPAENRCDDEGYENPNPGFYDWLFWGYRCNPETHSVEDKPWAGTATSVEEAEMMFGHDTIQCEGWIRAYETLGPK